MPGFMLVHISESRSVNTYSYMLGFCMFVMGLLLNLPRGLVGLIWGSFGICSRFLESIIDHSSFLVICPGFPHFCLGFGFRFVQDIFARCSFMIQLGVCFGLKTSWILYLTYTLKNRN